MTAPCSLPQSAASPCLRLFTCVLAVLLAPQPAGAGEPVEPWVPAAGPPHFFAVRVEDVGRSVQWYRRTFGLEESTERASGDGWEIANLQSDALWVEIVRDDRAREAERPRGFVKVGFAVADVEVVAGRVERATGERPRIVDDERHGVRILQLRDPDGNVVQLSSPLAATNPGSSAAERPE